MIIVLGHVDAGPGTIDDALALSLDHVRRSREEPGCISHQVHRDVENPYRLVFVERWTDRDALTTHFQVPESAAFAEAVTQLAVEDPVMEIYTAS
jgi:quinol monooxygenase YgiN